MTTDLNTYASQKIRSRIEQNGGRYWAGDNISQYIEEGERDELINELTIKFDGVLNSLVIDTDTDPNSMDTARRLAKMYINELMSGRYDPMPNATAFPNHTEDRYDGMLLFAVNLQACVHIITKLLKV